MNKIYYLNNNSCIVKTNEIEEADGFITLPECLRHFCSGKLRNVSSYKITSEIETLILEVIENESILNNELNEIEENYNRAIREATETYEKQIAKFKQAFEKAKITAKEERLHRKGNLNKKLITDKVEAIEKAVEEYKLEVANLPFKKGYGNKAEIYEEDGTSYYIAYAPDIEKPVKYLVSLEGNKFKAHKLGGKRKRIITRDIAFFINGETIKEAIINESIELELLREEIRKACFNFTDDEIRKAFSA